MDSWGTGCALLQIGTHSPALLLDSILKVKYYASVSLMVFLIDDPLTADSLMFEFLTADALFPSILLSGSLLDPSFLGPSSSLVGLPAQPPMLFV